MTGLTSGALHGVAVEPVRNEKARRCSAGLVCADAGGFQSAQ